MPTIVREIPKFLHENNAAYQSLKRWNQADKESPRKFIIKVYIAFPILTTKTAATESKYIKKKNIFLNFTNICHIPEWILFVFKNVSFFQNPLDGYFEHFVLRLP